MHMERGNWRNIVGYGIAGLAAAGALATASVMLRDFIYYFFDYLTLPAEINFYNVYEDIDYAISHFEWASTHGLRIAAEVSDSKTVVLQSIAEIENMSSEYNIGFILETKTDALNLAMMDASDSGTFFWCSTAVAEVCALGVMIAAMIYAESKADEVGGICGEAEGHTVEPSIFNRCVNYGYIKSADAYGGGIVGVSDDYVCIFNCVNFGNICGDEQIGGIAGSMKSGGVIESCANFGSVYANSGKDVADIVGDMDSSAKDRGGHVAITVDPAKDGTTKGTTTYLTLQSIASGKAAYLLNQKGSNYWTQNIGSNIYPLPYAANDSTNNYITEESQIDANANTWTYVSTRDEFVKALNDRYAHIRLTADINLTDDDKSLVSYCRSAEK